MSDPIFIHQYASGETHADFEFPGGLASWFMPVGSGSVVVSCEGVEDNQIYTAVGGEVIQGSFTKLVSTSCTRLLMGNGPPPVAALATVGASAATSLDTRVSTEESARASAATSLGTRISSDVSAETSLTTRISTEASTRTSADTSLTTRISTAESVEASKG